jgi:hypothetical protein
MERSVRSSGQAEMFLNVSGIAEPLAQNYGIHSDYIEYKLSLCTIDRWEPG